MKRNKWTAILIYLVLACVVVAGLSTTLFAFGKIENALLQEYDAHLLDLGRSVDRNLQNTLDRCRYELQRELTRPRVAQAQADYEQNGDAETLKDIVVNSLETHSGILSAIVILDDGVPIACTHCADAVCMPEFPIPKGKDDIGICVEEDGEYYVTFEQQSGRLTYLGLVRLDVFYEAIVVDSLQEEYWVVLYDSNSGILLENDGNIPTFHMMTQAEMMARDDGYTLLLESDSAGTSMTQTYSYKDTDTDRDVRCRMVTMNASDTRNGIFSLGLAANYEKIRKPIEQITGWLILSVCLIALVIAIAVFAWQRIANRYRKAKQHLIETKERLDNQEQAAHAQRLEMIGSMTAAISHDFNNLLTPIMGYSLMILESEKEDSPVSGYAAEIYQAAEKSKDMIVRMSSLTRKNTGGSYTEFSPDALVGKVLRIAECSKPEDVRVETDLRCGDEMIRANESQVMQVLLNLVINAFQAMENGTGCVSLSTRTDADSVIFTVSNDGPGIPDEYRDKIFEPFFTTKGTGKGTGLGLAISRQVAQAHGGSLILTDDPGTVFVLCLPRAPATDRS